MQGGAMAKARKSQPIGDDPVKVDPQHYKVEFENERVRVLRIKYGPGEKSVMHSHPDSIAVFLTDIHAKFTYPDGRTEDINANAGSVQHMDAFIHLPESVGDKPFEVIAVELKR
jgi:quercetin dioxygenase-like cupin family protein